MKKIKDEYKDPLLLSEFINMVSSDGISLNKISQSDKNNEELERFVLQNGQTFDFSFQMFDWKNYINVEIEHNLKPSIKELMKKLDYSNLKDL